MVFFENCLFLKYYFFIILQKKIFRRFMKKTTQQNKSEATLSAIIFPLRVSVKTPASF